MPGTSYKSLNCKTCLQKFPLYLETVEREGKKTTKDWIKRIKKTFLKVFKMLSYGKIWKIEDTSFKSDYSDSYWFWSCLSGVG